VPERAASFMAVRAAFGLLVLSTWLILWRTCVGRSHPEALVFAILALPEAAIAWMVPRTGSHLEAYLLGFTLAIYGSAVVVRWRWPLTGLLVGFIGVATVLSFLTGPGEIGADGVVATAFYLSRSGLRQHVTETALAAEQRRNELLVAELDRQSREDALTGIGNRRAWEERLELERRRRRRSSEPLALLVCDLDHLKELNDGHGHAAGDLALSSVGQVLRTSLRPDDFAARTGGDEFAVLCPDTGLEEALMLAHRLAAATRAALATSGRNGASVSIGVAALAAGEDGAGSDDPIDGLLLAADGALYRAKESRGTVQTAGTVAGDAMDFAG